MTKTAIILYEPEHVALLDVLIEKWSTAETVPVIVSLDAEIDYELERRGVPFVSGKALQDRAAPASYLRADELTKELCGNKELSFLTYRNVSLLEPLRLSIFIYFLYLLYYIDVIERFMEGASDVGRLIVPASTAPVSKTNGPLGIEETRFVIEAASRVAEGRGILFEEYSSIRAAAQFQNGMNEFLFSMKRVLFGLVLSFLNFCMALRPRRPIRLLVSDYWRNIAPLLKELPEAEIILIDRSEALQAGFSNVWRHKMRFMHIRQFLTWKGKRRAVVHADNCQKEWTAIRKQSLGRIDLVFHGVDFSYTSERIMTHLIENAVPNVICDIEGTYAMYEHLSPDAVLLRASVSGQRHFAILPLVAREVGIPALEVQHGGEYLGPGSATRQHPAHFIAAYGPLVCDEFRKLGYDAERLFPVGSPRFDSYVKDKKEKIVSGKSEISILSNTPSGNIGERYGTYSVEEYFHALGEAVRTVPDAHLSVAFRSAARGSFLAEARERGLHGLRYESVGSTPLPELFAEADIFVCSHSTVVYEALLSSLPVVIASFAPVERMMTDFHFSCFERAGALAIAHTPEELLEIVGKLAADAGARERMSVAGEAFMAEHFSFDGHAAERIADLVRSWAKRATAQK